MTSIARYLAPWVAAMALALPGASAIGQTTQVWTVEQLLQAAWGSHPAVLGKRSVVEAASADRDSAGWQRFPTPSFESDHRTSGSRNATSILRVDQPLWAGGRIDAGIDAAGRRLDAADAGLVESRHDIGLRVISAWAEASRQQARQEYAVNGVKEHEKLLQLIDRRVDREVSPKVDRDFAKSRLLQTMNDLSSVNQSLKNALNQLSQLAGRPVARAGGEPRGELPASPEVALEEALAYSPILKRLSAEEEAAVADIASKRSSLWPQLALRLEKSNGSPADGIQSYNRTMLVLTAQPGAGLSAASGIDAAVARREAARYARDSAFRDIQEQIALDWDDLVASRLRMENASQARAMAAEVFDSYTRQYTTGRKSWIDVLNAVRENTQADLAMADATSQAAAATMRLRLRTGQLLQTYPSDSLSSRQP